MTSQADVAAINAAMDVAKQIADGTLAPAQLDAAAVAECRQLVGQVIGPDDAVWPLQLEVARGVLAAGGVPADEMAEWLSVQRQAEGHADSAPPASTETVERTFDGVGVPETVFIDSVPPVDSDVRQHVLDDDCWCDPVVEVVEGRRGRRTHREAPSSSAPHRYCSRCDGPGPRPVNGPCPECGCSPPAVAVANL